MKMRNPQLSMFIVLAMVALAAACTSRVGLAPESEGETPQQTDESTAAPHLQALQQTDATVLVQLGRTYTHSFPAGFYIEYALNNLGDDPLIITLIPSGDQNMAVDIARSDNREMTVIDLNAGGAGEMEQTSFNPEAGVNYTLRVYEVSGKGGEYELTIAP